MPLIKNVTKSLRLNLTAASNNIVRNYFNELDNEQSGINEDHAIWDGFFDYGESNRFVQELQLNYELPFAKFPFFKLYQRPVFLHGQF